MKTTVERKLINEIFAAFLGWVKTARGLYTIPNTLSINADSDNTELDGWDMNFECSWDWIMVVVENIENLGHEGKFLVTIERGHCHINDFTGYRIVGVTTTGTTLDAVYSVINEFLFWYKEDEKEVTPDTILENVKASKVDWKKGK